MSEDRDQAALSRIYAQRFDRAELASKQILWEVLCRRVFQKFVPRSGVVLDLGAGNCEFINHIHAHRRIAVDLNPDAAKWAASDVEMITARSDSMSDVTDESVDTIFTSNFFEHLRTKEDLSATLAECHRILRPSGRIVVLMPNIRYLGGRYWDYFDHHLPLTHLSLSEALRLSGFRVDQVIPRFLPYTVKDAWFPVRAGLVEAYLAFRPAWSVIGRQMLVVGSRTLDR